MKSGEHACMERKNNCDFCHPEEVENSTPIKMQYILTTLTKRSVQFGKKYKLCV